MSVSKVYLMDNRKYMENIPDNFFDLYSDDPPYGINAEQGTNRAARKQFKDEKIGTWDSKPPGPDYFREAIRISKYQIFWGANHYISNLPAESVNSSCWITWDKLNPDRCFADCELAWTSFEQVARVYKEKRVQELNRLDGGKIHPTQKPVRLYHWQFSKFCQPGWKIFSGHVGSGSDRIAAHLLGFDFYGTEVAEHHFLNQEKRFKEYKESYGLFMPNEEIKFEL